MTRMGMLDIHKACLYIITSIKVNSDWKYLKVANVNIMFIYHFDHLNLQKRLKKSFLLIFFTPFGVSIIFVPTIARCVNTVCLLPFDTNGHKNDVNITLNIN